ncbi:STM4015 family protein [Actinoplanes sp. CA-252034]|uniref:STM4015 family protein n=1 Tax=Actinoplanes sp. CA-252034 TaxID=3239906 RepID=UPI003D997983
MSLGYEDYLDTFAGFPVWRWEDGVPEDPATVAWRIDTGHGERRIEQVLDEMLEDTRPDGPIALIIGNWGHPFKSPFPIDLLTGNADRFGALRALFIGEIAQEECEISWITQGDITPVLETFPGLQHLWVRGASRGLTLRPVRHENLHELVLQGGGLSADLVRALSACDLPLLEELELWLGVAQYGGDAGVGDLAPILAGRPMPTLTWLGLRNAEIADEIAAAVAAAPIVARLRVLDLSWGTLSDTGAEALLAGQPLTHLEHLVLNHHFMSPEVARRLVDDLPGVTVDVGGAREEEEEEWGRYTAVNE